MLWKYTLAAHFLGKEEQTMATPCCPKCGSTNIANKLKSFYGLQGLYIYCSSCGAIIAWVPIPD
jgi:formate dehydrogenase maturation protein FdhE